MELAIYGKGGIGKSTIAANLSAALSSHGRQILQIGCDPKHDSTRLLLSGRSPRTVLDYMRVTNPPEYSIDAILEIGYGGVGCVEAGGPEPGVGCAGRGIISMFELLSLFGLKDKYDITLYDVLGDVVCGGFAVPIRREYADTIFIITSGEYMALYAANNILRGIRNYDGDDSRVAGIILNRRGLVGESERASRFADAVGLPLVADIPRSEIFAQAEARNMTLTEFEPESQEANIFIDLAKGLVNGISKFPANPLTDEDLERTILGTETSIQITMGAFVESESTSQIIMGTNGICESTEACFKAENAENTDNKTENPVNSIDLSSTNRYFSKNVMRGEPLTSCAFNGALAISTQIRDAVVLAHAPKSCVYISYNSMSSTGRRQLFERGSLLPSAVTPNLQATDMDESEMVFGGMGKLTDKIEEIKASQPKAIIVVSACPPAIIGDDIDKMRDLSAMNTPIFTLRTDGNMSGDYTQGVLMSYMELARQIIRPDVKPEDNVVNILFERPISRNTLENYEMIESYLDQMGVEVNCRFLCDTKYDNLANFKRASLNILANHDFTSEMLKEFFIKEYDSKFFDLKLPVGFHETEDWLRSIGEIFGKESIAEDIIAKNKIRYDKEVSLLNKSMKGLRLMVVTYSHDLDWLLGAAFDAGMEIAKLCILYSSTNDGFQTRFPVNFEIEENYNVGNRSRDIERTKPDILLTNYTFEPSGPLRLADRLPMSPISGFFTGLDMLNRWEGLLAMNLKGEWEKDEQLFNQYYA
ncbi:MAG: nitrogen fixation protein NifH [Oscillospiraceae bacterium]|nr:nitrogen fixation protein NifH [Oscillospiraceae bacterium]